MLIKCEVPVPWAKCLDTIEVKKQLNTFFRDCPDIEIKGGSEARALY